MCGIAGALAASPEARIGPVVRTITAGLAHRGPDAAGFWACGESDAGELRSPEELDAPLSIVLGHRRLSIVDLEGGAQPMSDAAGTVWVSFNGEIFNHLALRAELERAGHRFRTRADTEVLVHGFKRWGVGLLERLNGIFAFALFDSRSRELLLARDPVGVKPLYLGTHGRLTWWSSELGPARDAGLVEREPSADGLKLFLCFRFVPSPHTIFDHVWKVPPGHYAVLRTDQAGGQPLFHRYGSSIRSSASPRTAGEWRESVADELDAAVERQLMSDVPVSVLLSGGIDSSLVTQLMTSHLDYRPDSFGIGFGSEHEHSEALAARFAADKLGVPHDSSVVADRDYLAAWPGAITELGEPIANTGALLVRMICERIGQTHKVALSGQGADEPLGGYPRHVTERIYQYGRFAPATSRGFTQRLFGAESGDRLIRALSSSDRVDRYIQIFSVLPLADIDALVPGSGRPATDLAREAVSRWCDPVAPADTVNELLRVDTRLSLADDLLIIGDLFSMRSSVELRVPFLDLQLLELLERMPSVYKISRLGRRKWLYREAALERLPRALSDSLAAHGRFARKRGFSTPQAWFETDYEHGGLEDSLAGAGVSVEALRSLHPALGARQRASLMTLALWAGGKTSPLLASN